MIVVLGLPGLYQNWLMSVLDLKSITKSICSNLLTTFDESKIKLLFKINEYQNNPRFIDQYHGTMILNTYVSKDNFIWYMSNFLGKTDEHFIDIDDLLNELHNKADGTVAFHGFYHHFIDSYKINYQDEQYQRNALIEFLYLGFVSDDNIHKNIASLQYDLQNVVNIEYADFNSKETIKEKISMLGVDTSNFDQKYVFISEKNKKYINQKNHMKSMVQARSDISHFNELDQARLGYLISESFYDKPLDWFNQSNRSDLYRIHRYDIIMLL